MPNSPPRGGSGPSAGLFMPQQPGFWPSALIQSDSGPWEEGSALASKVGRGRNKMSAPSTPRLGPGPSLGYGRSSSEGQRNKFAHSGYSTPMLSVGESIEDGIFAEADFDFPALRRILREELCMEVEAIRGVIREEIRSELKGASFQLPSTAAQVATSNPFDETIEAHAGKGASEKLAETKEGKPANTKLQKASPIEGSSASTKFATKMDREPDGAGSADERRVQVGGGSEATFHVWQPKQQESAYHAFLYRHFAPLMRAIAWWMELREPERSGKLAKIEKGSTFGMSAAFVILLYTIWTYYETDYAAANIGSGSTTFQRVVEMLFLLAFSAELSVKIAVHKQYFFCNTDWNWNVFDSFLVALAWYDLLIGSAVDFDTKILRSMRVLKVARVLRAFKMVHFLLALRQILNSLVASVSSLFWCIVTMAVMFYMFAVLFVQGTTTHLIEQLEVDHMERSLTREKDLMTRFGSIGDAMLSLFKATTGGDDWSLFFNTVAPLGPLYACIFLFFVAFSQIACLNIITAKFVEHAIETMKNDREDVVMQQRCQKLREERELSRLVKQADLDGNGQISGHQLEEFLEGACGQKLVTYLEAEGMEADDALRFFQLLEAKSLHDDGTVDIGDFVQGCIKMKGQASSLDMQCLNMQVRSIFARVKHVEARIGMEVKQKDFAI